MKESIILAGGLGTRLQSVVSAVPKCMAEINNLPFLDYLYQYLVEENFDHIILALGYKSDVVLSWLEKTPYKSITSFVIEEEALGTGGAIKLACSKLKETEAYIVNGDTLFKVNTDGLREIHMKQKADISIALKPLEDFDRYGSVSLNSNDRITYFNEKAHCKKGLINGGVYLINKELFDKLEFPHKFSFEKEVLEKLTNELNIFGNIQDEYFIDIGIPEDYKKAQIDFKRLFK